MPRPVIHAQAPFSGAPGPLDAGFLRRLRRRFPGSLSEGVDTFEDGPPDRAAGLSPAAGLGVAFSAAGLREPPEEGLPSRR